METSTRTSPSRHLGLTVLILVIATQCTLASSAVFNSAKGRRADPKTGGANPTMVRILRSVNTDRMSQPEILDDTNEATEVLEEFDGDVDDLVEKIVPVEQVDPAPSNRMKPKRGNLFLRSSRAAYNPGYQVVGCPCHAAVASSNSFDRSMTSQPRVMTSSNGNFFNKRFENGPNDIVLVGGSGNGDPVFLRTFKRGVFFRTSRSSKSSNVGIPQAEK